MDIDIFTNFQLAEGIDVFQNVYHRMALRDRACKNGGLEEAFLLGVLNLFRS